MESNKLSWSKPLGGCALILIVIAAFVSGIYYVRSKEKEQETAIRQALLDGYWASLGTDSFSEICERSSTADRLINAPTEVVAKNFQSFKAKHGPLKQVIFYKIRSLSVIGDQRSWTEARVQMKFQDGRSLVTAYKLLPKGDKEGWLIDSTTTPDREASLPVW